MADAAALTAHAASGHGVPEYSLAPGPMAGREALTPAKLAMWLFLGTEVMFFTGLIGGYLVLRGGSSNAAYSDTFPPNTPQAQIELVSADLAREGIYPKFYQWPRPFDEATNPLNIPLTAVNTIILMTSSVTLSIGIARIRRGDKAGLSRWLLISAFLGSVFLGVQVYEYASLLFLHGYPATITPTGHFTPDVSLFASCFYVMTGFHGAHVAGGVVCLFIVWLQSLRPNYYTRERHASVENAGLYWHFVDLVWILLFTVVYLI